MRDTTPEQSRRVVIAIFWTVVIGCFLGAMVGCGSKVRVPAVTDTEPAWSVFGSGTPTGMSGRDEAQYRLRNAANAIGIVGGLCALAAVGTLIASFFVPLIPRKMAWYCLAGALLGWATQYFLLIYGVAFFEIAIWGTIAVAIITGAVVGLPWLTAWTRRRLLNRSKTLAADGDYRAAVALEVTALPERFPKPIDRKVRLGQLITTNGGAS